MKGTVESCDPGKHTGHVARRGVAKDSDMISLQGERDAEAGHGKRAGGLPVFNNALLSIWYKTK